MNTNLFPRIATAFLFCAMPVAAACGQESKKTAPESPNCVVHNLNFRYTRQAQGNSGKSYGKITHVWCDFNDTTMGENEMVKCHRSEKGVLVSTSGGITLPEIICHQTSNNDSPHVEITWAILEDIYGYDAIKENRIPPGCRLAAILTAAAKQGASQ